MGGVDTAPEMERMTDMRVYADQAATTSLSKTALEAMLSWRACLMYLGEEKEERATWGIASCLGDSSSYRTRRSFGGWCRPWKGESEDGGRRRDD